MRVLVTGGAGFIGSHVLVELLGQGAKVVVLDNLVNGSSESLKRVERITGHSVGFVLGDVRDSLLVERLLIDEKVDAVIHLAGLKAVGESVDDPLEYYESNVQELFRCYAPCRGSGYSRLSSVLPQRSIRCLAPCLYPRVRKWEAWPVPMAGQN